MQLATQRISLPLIGLVVAATAATIWLIPAEYLPYWLVGIGVVVGFMTYVVLGDPLIAILAWFTSVTCLDEEFARLILPGFFNLTIPRVFLAVLILVFLAMVGVGRLRVRWAWPTSALMLLILACFTASAAVSGFKTASIVSVHYRLIGGYWFPFLLFFMLSHAIRYDRDVRRVLVFFFFLGLYLTFTGWAEHFKLWSLVWPGYISDPTKGIHWGRVRGPFLASPIMGLVMVYIFFNNLVLARNSGPVRRLACWAAAATVLPVVFWTQTRSVWLAMALGGMIWIGLARRGYYRIVGISLILAFLIAGAAYNWRNIASGQREVGGVASVEPIYVRLGLLLITWDIFKDYPATGVGFGHFRDVAPRYAHNPASPYYRFASSAIEHNNFLSVLAECGVVGLILYVWLLVALVRASLRVYRRLPPSGSDLVSRDLVVLYWILFVDFLVDAMFRETSVSPFANCLFFGLSAVVFAIDYLLGPEPLVEPSSAPISAASPSLAASI
jgi:hypothetical protein